MTSKSPLAPKRFPNLLAVAGVRLSSGAADIRYRGRDDLVLFEFEPGTAVAGVLTNSSMPSAPVVWCRDLLTNSTGNPSARALVVNAGNANAFTGRDGMDAAAAVARSAADLMTCPVREVYLASTGVIGELLPADKMSSQLPALYERLASGGWRAATRAMQTTDTFAKGVCRIARIDGQEVVINGIAKGSGMIQPDMATMLAFVFTNAEIPSDVLQEILAETNAVSFNSISVDGDTSTSDTVLAFATGRRARHGKVTEAGDRRLDDFRKRFGEVMIDLAQQIVRDGEGASKFITVTVSRAASDADARAVAFAIANSPLFKTAVAGADANWGRIVMAVGKAGAKAVPETLIISIGGQAVTEGGHVRADYDERQAAGHLKGDTIDIAVDLGLGQGGARIWTCDLTSRYIAINADYRT